MLDVATVVRATAARVVQILPGGELLHGSLARAELAVRLDDVVIDSRRSRAEALFVALAGERSDGHDYVKNAMEQGARGCIVSRLPETVPQAHQASRSRFLFLVPNTKEALQNLARYWRLHHGACVIGITGSIGKTTTKEIVASVLASKFAVLRSEANFNTEIGLPLSLLRLQPHHEAAILEMGMYLPGDIALLAGIALPEVGIVTNVAPIHLERAGSIERIARGKSELPAALPGDGLAILNGDDPWTVAMANASGVAPVVMTGTGPNCDYRAENIETLGLDGTRFVLAADGQRCTVRTRVPGAHTVQAFLMAAAVAQRLGMTWDDIISALQSVRLETRQKVIRQTRGPVIIDDSYNASPPSMNAALQLLHATAGTRIAILGDMLELGPTEREQHEAVGKRAAERVDWLIVVGDRGRWIAEGALRTGMPAQRVLVSGSNVDAAHNARSIMTRSPVPSPSSASPTMQRSDSFPGRGDGPERWTILVKGSRGMKMEEVVDELRGEE